MKYHVYFDDVDTLKLKGATSTLKIYERCYEKTFYYTHYFNDDTAFNDSDEAYIVIFFYKIKLNSGFSTLIYTV